MVYWIVNWSVKFRRIVIALTAGLLVFGFLQMDDVKQDILPEFSPTIVEVQTEALGLSAAEVEQLITVPLEQDLLNGVAFLETIESASLPGLSSVVMTFESGTDLLDARQVVAERLTQAAGLPQVSDPPQMIQPLSSTSRVAMVALESDELTPIETSVLARWVMVPRLLGVEGVANVAIWGFRDQQLQVLVDPSNLAEQNVALSQIISTAGNALEVSPLSFLEASSPGTGGFIDTVNQRLHVFHEQAISTPEQLAQVTLEGVEGGAVFVAGQPLVLGDVAEIVTDHQPLIGDALCAGGPCILLVVEKFPDANTPAVAEGVDEALAALSLGLPGMEIDSSIYRPAGFIDASIDNLRGTLVVGAFLLLLVLAALFLNWRIALIAVVSIASSLVVAGVILLLLDAAVNAMILAGLVMAIVVIIDDAVVGAWGSAQAARDEGPGGGQVVPAVIDSILSLRTVALYAALIGAAALLPVFAMDGEAGAFLEPVTVAYLLAIAAALIVSVTVAPALSVLLLGGLSHVTRESGFSTWLRGLVRRVSALIVPRTTVALVVFGVFVVAGLASVASVSPSLRPDLKERDILIQLESAPGTSLIHMDEITAQVVGDLRTQPGIANVGAHVGRAIMSDQVVNVNSAEVWLTIEPSADYDATIAGIESTVDGYDEVAVAVTTYSEQRIDDLLGGSSDGLVGGSSDGLVVRVYGENPEIRETMAEQVREVIGRVDGVDEATLAAAAVEPVIEIEVDVETAQTFGVKPGDIRRQAATLVSGLVVGNLFEDQKVFDVVVWGDPGVRGTVEDIRALPMATPSGDHVPLGDLAEVRVVPNPTVIYHESVATYVDVAAIVAGRSLGAVAADVDLVLRAIDFPLEHHAELLGGFEDAAAGRSRVIATIVAALIFIYLLLQAAFGSWRLATLGFLLLPMAVSGSLIAVALSGGNLTLGSVAGTLAIFGLAARGVLLMVRGYENRERRGDAFGGEMIVDETARLAVPAISSAIGIAVVFAPLAVAGSRAGLEIAGPMAVAVLGGLVTTGLLNVVVLPAMYSRWGYVAVLDLAADDLFADISDAPAVAVTVAETPTGNGPPRGQNPTRAPGQGA